MTATDEQRSHLTSKQRQVLDLLTAGEEPPAIAKRLKVTPSAVYGHMRNIRSRGVALPAEQMEGDTEAAPVALVPSKPDQVAVLNNGVDVRPVLEEAIQHSTDRLGAIDDEVATLQARIVALAEQREREERQRSQHQQALAAYNS